MSGLPSKSNGGSSKQANETELGIYEDDVRNKAEYSISEAKAKEPGAVRMPYNKKEGQGTSWRKTFEGDVKSRLKEPTQGMQSGARPAQATRKVDCAGDGRDTGTRKAQLESLEDDISIKARASFGRKVATYSKENHQCEDDILSMIEARIEAANLGREDSVESSGAESFAEKDKELKQLAMLKSAEDDKAEDTVAKGKSKSQTLPSAASQTTQAATAPEDYNKSGKKSRDEFTSSGVQIGAIPVRGIHHCDENDDTSWDEEAGNLAEDELAIFGPEEGCVRGLAVNDAGQLISTGLEKGTFPGLTGDDNDLAVAVPVSAQEEENNEYLPSAVEYDPDSKPVIEGNHRFRIKLVLAFALFLLLVMAAMISLLLRDEDANGEPYRERIGIRELVETVVGTSRLESATSPYARALEWVTHQDPRQLLPDDSEFMQRYTAAYFYFATSEDHGWASCGPAMDEIQNEACSHQLLEGLDPLQLAFVPANRWLSSAHVCYWAGIICDDQMQVRKIGLGGNNLTGTFPDGVQYFSHLQHLGMALGGIRGPLPADLVLLQMKHLVELDLRANDISGTIPLELWQARNLQTISIGRNRLTGSISTQIGQLVDMKGLFLFENQIQGTLPTELGQLQSVAYIRLYSNQITGPIPTEIGSLQHSLLSLELQQNQLSGSIPTEIGLLSMLYDFRIHFNPVSGIIPEEFWDAKPERVDMYNCNLTGTLSDKIGMIPTLDVLRVSNNRLTGIVPESLANATTLSYLWLNGNDFQGTMPDSLCRVRTDFRLAELQADCLVDPSSNFAELECDASCCTLCCDAQGERCV